MLALSFPVLDTPSLRDKHLTYVDVESALGFSELSGLLLLAIAWLRYVSIKTIYHQHVFRRLLSDNGWAFVHQFEDKEIASVLMGKGVRDSYDTNYAFRGIYNKLPFSCQVFSFIEPTYQDSRTRSFICMHFRLSRSFPMIVLDNRLNDHGGSFHHLSDLPNHIPRKATVDLEGDFNNHYKVYVSAGNEHRALQILSPDLMAMLEDLADTKVDIEINAQDVFLIYVADFYTEASLGALFSVANTLRSGLDRLSKTWLASDGKTAEEDIYHAAHATRNAMIDKHTTSASSKWLLP